MYRPELPGKIGEEEEDMVNIMQLCWEEEPTKRPDFSVIKKKLKLANKDG